MEQSNHRADPIAALLEDTGATAVIQVDADGYQRVVFRDDERERFRSTLAEELREAIEKSRDRWERAREMIRVYEGKSKEGEQTTTVVPIAKRNANQMTAYIVQTILGRSPIASARPQDYGDMEIVYQTEQGPVVDKASIEEVCEGLEAMIQDILEARVPFRSALTEFVSDLVGGVGVPMLKWAYEKDTRVVRQYEIEPTMSPVQVGEDRVAFKAMIKPFPREVSVAKGCPHKIVPVSCFNWVGPADMLDVQDSPWFAERLPRLDGMALHTKIKNKDYDFGLPDGTEPDEELVRRVIQGKPPDSADNPQPDPEKDDVTSPREYQDAWEVYIYWPVRLESGEIEIMDLCVDYHLGAQEILRVRKNPYAHNLRPYTPGFYRKRTHRFESGSVVEDMEPFQDLVSSLYRLQIQNGVQATLKAYMVRRGSPAHQDLMAKKGAGGVKPGDIITFADPGEIVPFQTGGSVGSLYNEMNFAMQEADRQVNLSDLDRGDIPGRTADAAIARVHEQSTMQRAMALEAVREALSLGFYMLLENIRQYSPTGDTLATFDPRKRAMQERVIAMPTGALAEKFRIVVNASSQDQTREAERERLTIDYNMIVGSNAQIMQSAATLFHPETTEPYEAIVKFCLQREEDSLRRLLSLHRNDAETATLDEMELEAILQAKREALAQQQQMAAAQPPQQQAEGGEAMDPSMMGMEGVMDPAMMEMMNGSVPQDQLQPPPVEAALPPQGGPGF